MTRLLTTALLTATFALSTMAATTAETRTACLPHEAAVSTLVQGSGELRVGLGIGSSIASDHDAVYEIYVAETGTWTILVTHPQGLSCIAASGDRWTTSPLLAGDLGLRVAAPPSRELIRQAQALLARLGYEPGHADGVSGRRTEAAVRAYQQAHGLAVDGLVSDALVGRLEAERVPVAVVTPPPPADDEGGFTGERTITYPNGAVYEGAWVNDQYEGQGTHTTADGDVYVGEFRDGE